MRLYQKRYQPLVKLAGTKISKNPQQWGAEVLKALASQHPYVDESDVDIKVNYMDPEEKRAFGVVIVAGRAAVVFSIGPSEQTGQIELNPLDVMFVPNKDGDDGQFRHLSEFSFRDAIDQGGVGDVFPKGDGESYSQLPPSNEYIGDMTGDVTPLEWSSYDSMGGGNAMRTAGSGLLSCMLRDRTEVTTLSDLLDSHHGIGRAAKRLGLRDSLDNLLPEGDETEDPFDTSPVVQIRKDDHNHLFVDFDGGETQPISAIELKELLHEEFKPMMREVMDRGWAFVRNFPTVRSPEVPMFNTLPTPIEEGGWHRVVTKSDKPVDGLVCTQMLDFDGGRLPRQKVICADGKFDEGKVALGSLAGEGKLPVGTPRSGTLGCFLDESAGFVATPNIRITKTITLPDDGTVLVGTRMDTMQPIGLVLVDNLLKPQKVESGHYDQRLIPDNAYYFPANLTFLELKDESVGVVDATERDGISAKSDKRPKATMRKNAGWYHLAGKVRGGHVNTGQVLEGEMRLKLASLGADDHAIERICEMGDGQMELRGLRRSRMKLASQDGLPRISAEVTNSVVRALKKCANDAMEGYNEAMQAEKPDPMEDPQALDAILSLQFVSDENLEEISEADNLFEMVEDKLARMLLAARQGEVSIHEKGVQRALKGIGEARKSIKTLNIELESREHQ